LRCTLHRYDVKVSGIASGSLGKTPVSDFRTNSDAKVIIHDFFGVPKMQSEAISGHISWIKKITQTNSKGNLFNTLILLLRSRLKSIFETTISLIIIDGWTQKRREKDLKQQSQKYNWKWSQWHKGAISGVNIPLELYISSVVVTSCQRLGRTLLLKIARLTSRSMKFTYKMHKKRCGDEKNWNAIHILPHLNISNPEGLGETLKAWSTLEDFQKRKQKTSAFWLVQKYRKCITWDP